ncbi:hypothetical protein SDC9_157813 [bioreactor metagenome]|uniref:Uncharacterized protein n=1 Tax=bioreactor metagenome TaxID=1076179 RepID=A0A645F835_9ZZZZ
MARIRADRNKPQPGGGGHIPSIQKSVDIDLSDSLVLCHAKQGIKMGDVTVDTPVGQKTHQMKGGTLLDAVVHRRVEDFVLEKTAVFNG